jgi:putative OmpL-like beta-barrel porin-2
LAVPSQRDFDERTWAEPTYRTGVRVTASLAESLAITAFWVNGWNANILEGNGMRAFAAAVSTYPVKGLEVDMTYMGDLERAPLRLNEPVFALRNEVNVTGTYSLPSAWSFAVATPRTAALPGGASRATCIAACSRGSRARSGATTSPTPTDS